MLAAAQSGRASATSPARQRRKRRHDDPGSTMSHTHSEAYLFQVELRGLVYDCSFVLTDNRMITVTAAEHRHTQALGTSPPRAVAVSIATELLQRELGHHQSTLADHPPSPRRKSWIDRILDRFGRAEPICLHC